jgi:hypothetical protein
MESELEDIKMCLENAEILRLVWVSRLLFMLPQNFG